MFRGTLRQHRGTRRRVVLVGGSLAFVVAWTLFPAAGLAQSTVKSAGAPSSDKKSSDAYPRGTLPDALGGQVDLAKARGDRATVFICLSSECPISNGYIPTLNRLADDYKA